MELHRTERDVIDGRPFEWHVHSAREFDGDVRLMITNLKYAFETQWALPLARLAAPIVSSVVRDHAIITWIPTTSAHLRERGHDHAELIARHVGALCGTPVRRMLRREGDTTQTGHGRIDRLRGPEFAPRPSRRALDLVIVDDVTTTGATFRNAARALSTHASVTCVAVAWVP